MNLDVFQSEMILRLIWAIGIAGLGLAVYWLVNRILLVRARAKVPALKMAHPGTPVLLYFTTPTCVPCKTVQRPAIQRVSQQIGSRVQVLEIDASQQPELASQWGVMSVPTTFLIDAKGRPRHINHGVAPAEKLLKQIGDIF